jgi:hypothetical protein
LETLETKLHSKYSIPNALAFIVGESLKQSTSGPAASANFSPDRVLSLSLPPRNAGLAPKSRVKSTNWSGRDGSDDWRNLRARHDRTTRLPLPFRTLVLSYIRSQLLLVRLSATVTSKLFPLYHFSLYFPPYFFISRSGSP